ncbi:type I restriction enzyme HsdR N-terminal domain-containing protein [Flammeovirga agarivorans]|uniref:Type I restriction enzyme HsdR N-terminal domain-containing protein n=1 Tax=Flammeovirga agarivorans TaxID=2726742 RepID=A0A7X8SM40_9BACT|nr:type I restriction enzyme HsdR N-terminal domain-containing protein [Flammeovirga agarivorans]NLR92666.1 type I restriction enzyme HsdR N-terminal domain-containing protein [Flammeovirga agarivorans]
MKYLSKGKRDRVISINKKTNEVTYLPHTKTRSLNNPEEKVQLETYLKLIYDYNYPAEYVRVCVPVKMGSSTKEADIITYNDMEGLEPFMIVECKKKGVSSSVFEGAIDQGFSYASAILAKFVWTTDGKQDTYHEVIPTKIGERTKNILPSPPPFKKSDSFLYSTKKNIYRLAKAPFKVLSHFFKRPCIKNAMIYNAIILGLMFIFSKVIMENIHQILAIPFIKNLWVNHHMDFSWMYYFISFTSVFITIIVSSIVGLLNTNKKGRIKLKQAIFLSLFLVIPVWFAGSEFTKSWWNWQHFTTMKYQPWLFLGPQLAISPIQILLFAGILSLSKPKKNTRHYKRLAK